MKYVSYVIVIFGVCLGLTACTDEAKTTTTAATKTTAPKLDNSTAPPAAVIAHKIPDYAAEKVAAHTWVIHGPIELPNKANKGFMNNPIIVISDKSVVIMDPGSSVYAGRMVLRQVKKLTDNPVTHIFNSHIHGDHWLGNEAIHDAYPDAKIYAHPEMIIQANAGGGQEWLDLMEQLSEGETKGTQVVLASLALQDGQEIKVDDITLRAHLIERAHTNTDVLVEVMDDSLLALGDTVLRGRLGRLDDGSFRGSINTCKKALALKLSVYVPGHGKTGDAASALSYCHYLETLYNEAGIHAEEGLSDFEIKPLIREKFAAFEKWVGFDEEFGKHISLAVLEYEQASFE